MPHLNAPSAGGDSLDAVEHDLREAQALLDFISRQLDENRSTLALLEVAIKFLRGRLSSKDEQELADEVRALLNLLNVNGIFGTEEDTGLVASKSAIVKRLNELVAGHLGRG